ncbi:DUF6098 family protein [Streptomyces sp. NPDC059740]|uniref:DUF6098 family protein n=1 Tax=Streptomyces sp. NPDC059740 TaxID=3346926 RepID=UPI00364C0F5E
MEHARLPTYTSLRQLVDLVGAEGGRVFVRWSRGPRYDLAPGQVSTDELTGVAMPGLSASPLGVEEWWEDRPLELWVARRVYDYSHLREVKGPDVRPWTLTGREVGRGPDNEPLVTDARPVAWVGDRVIAEAVDEVARQRGAWGPLRRPTHLGHEGWEHPQR